jgi:hypothetical protein
MNELNIFMLWLLHIGFTKNEFKIFNILGDNNISNDKWNSYLKDLISFYIEEDEKKKEQCLFQFMLRIQICEEREIYVKVKPYLDITWNRFKKIEIIGLN